MSMLAGDHQALGKQGMTHYPRSLVTDEHAVGLQTLHVTHHNEHCVCASLYLCMCVCVFVCQSPQVFHLTGTSSVR